MCVWEQRYICILCWNTMQIVSLTHRISITGIQSDLLNSVSFGSLKGCFTKFQSVALGGNGCPGITGADLKHWLQCTRRKASSFPVVCLRRRYFSRSVKQLSQSLGTFTKITVAGAVTLAMLSQKNKFFLHLHLV